MGAAGFSLPSTSLQLEPRTVVVAMLVGVLVTVVSALVPGTARHQGAADRGAA